MNMFNFKKKFEFLEDGIDFPFYNDKPKLTEPTWALLAVAATLFVILCFVDIKPKILHALLYCLVVLVPALYICRGNYGIFFR